MKKSLVSDAKSVFNALNGICCVYKPAGETLNRVRNSFLYKLSSELCDLQSKPPTPYVLIEGDTTKPLNIKVFPSFVDSELVIGPKYVPSDFKCIWVNNLGINSSGVLVAALNDGIKTGHKIRHSNPLRTYRVKGCLGEAKSNLFISGKTINYGNYKHVTKKTLDQLVATVQSSHQRKMFDLCGVDMQSEAAYQLAARGLVRPRDRKIPVIYGIKCVQFQPPHFTIGFTNGLDCMQTRRTYSNEASQGEHVERSESMLRVLSSKRNNFLELHRFKLSKITAYTYEKWLEKTKREMDCFNQRFVKERHSFLGNDLATAHFIVFRGGKVKFHGNDEWISKNKDEEYCDKFPNKYVEGWDIECVDASTLPLRYEGLKNLEGLAGLKWLSFKGCPYIDDWCVDKISGEYQETLEYLDLSDCPSLSKNVLSSLYRLKNLKTLKLYNVPSCNTFQFSALLLEDILPNLTIEGVNYIEIKE